MDDSEDARAWDLGCASDAGRNEFVVPELCSFIEKFGPRSIIDVGTGTAYIPRKVAEKHPSVIWKLVDIDESMLQVAQQCLPASSTVTYHCVSIFDAKDIDLGADVCLVANTLLEIDLSDQNVRTLTDLVVEGGWLLIFVPDTLIDASRGEDELRSYCAGMAEISKIDKFTGRPYRFLAHRLTDLISAFVSRGMVLALAKKGTVGTGHYFFGFRKLSVG